MSCYIIDIFNELMPAKSIFDMTSVFKCKRPFRKDRSLTKTGKTVTDKILKLLKMASVLSNEPPSKSYKAYYAIYNIKRFIDKRTVISDYSEIDNNCFGAIQKSQNFLLLKESLTAFELEALNEQAILYNKIHPNSEFINKYDVHNLTLIAKEHSPNYSLTDLFAELECSRPFFVDPKVINKNTDTEHTQYLTHSGEQAYKKLTEIISFAHAGFGYPDIIDTFDSIVDRDWY